MQNKTRAQRVEELYDIFMTSTGRLNVLLEKMTLANYDAKKLREELLLASDASIEHARMAADLSPALSEEFYGLALDMMLMGLEMTKDQHSPRIPDSILRRAEELTITAL